MRSTTPRGPAARWRLALLILAAALAAVGVPAGAQTPRDRFTFALSGSPDTLDPQGTAATLAFQVNKSLFDTLVEPDDEGRIVPSLAESWTTSADGLTWTFRLRPNVRFHHGKTLDAGDVKATFERILNPATRSPKRSDFAAIRSIEAVDPLTVRFVLGERFAPFLATLAHGWGAILPADLIARNHEFATRPVGTGPFTVAEWQRDSLIRLSRFDGYWIQGEPRLREVLIRFVPESAVKVAGLLAGEFDAIDAVAFLDLPRVRANPNVRVIRQVTSLVNVVAINTSRPALRDVRVRRALWHAIDRRQVLQTAYGQESVPVNVFMDVVSPYYVSIPDPFPYDPERARRLLSEAGASGLTLDLALPQPYPAHIEAGQLVQAMLQRVGVTARPRVVEWGFWLSRVFAGGEYDLTIIGHTGKLDPDGRLAGYGTAGRNYVRYENPKVEDLILAGRITTNPELRKRIYAEALKMMAEDAPMVYLGTPVLYMATRQGVRNFRQLYAIDTFDFRKTTK
ncbi:MAG: ABC transporter substrate-binding protein [Armatimonadota bacterium]|nr:ABC transporter substrate-binding protein [Armatimonadota bacterium]MDR7422035.1 ABC transporter substrate-binding protein [Armatimonadota bacterium]MDR7458096.1 ABC transporter substrate-binding protein [Armatimonadota bacterium]MDR7498044.1 ABC transporter substrate-binding protein [Armatimonadota bacterium]MDR7512878.1 ABC transporter substrate-binding protein [Armatimonadota bacterium]